MPDFRQRLILLKPMRPGVSGYARLQGEGGATLAQLNARGLDVQSVQAFWYGAGSEARLMGSTRVNPHGEASLTAELPRDALAPERLQALLLLSGGSEPVPLMIGLCVQQSAGSLLDAKNAALALCERLGRKAAPVPKSPPPAPETPPPPPPPPPRRQERGERLPREIFLPAIDPLPYVEAARRACAEPPAPEPPDPEPWPATEPPPRRQPPADRLRPLRWPRGFEALRPYFAKGVPCRLLDLPGWRFVNAAQAGGPDGLWVGICQIDGRVRRIAYAHRSETPPPGGGAYRPLRGMDGHIYQVLLQQV